MNECNNNMQNLLPSPPILIFSSTNAELGLSHSLHFLLYFSAVLNFGGQTLSSKQLKKHIMSHKTD